MDNTKNQNLQEKQKQGSFDQNKDRAKQQPQSPADRSSSNPSGERR